MNTPSPSIVNGAKAQADAGTQDTVGYSALARPQELPSIDKLLQLPGIAAQRQAHGHSLVAAETKTLAQGLRERCLAGQLPALELAPAALEATLATRVQERLAPRLKAVINLSGTVIHTNLGRAPLPPSALAYVQAVLQGASNLEFDLATGSRGDRDSLVEGLLCELTGAQAGTVVNNNAAAVLLTLNAMAHGKEVIISRGEQVEIGGAFRMPDVMAAAGAHMVEVGTTNRTHLRDYEAAITARTALLLKVHTSNYAVQGFTQSVSEAQLAALARQRGLPVASDLGSGALVDLASFGAPGLPTEPMPQPLLQAGCDVVMFSGDKLLGGPQAGLIVGSRESIARIRKAPMKRALRVGKLTLAALEATLRLYLSPEHLLQHLPTLRWLVRHQADIRLLAQTLQPQLQTALAPRYTVAVADVLSQIGSGSLPVDRLPSAGLEIRPSQTTSKGIGTALDALAGALRGLPQPVVGRIAQDALWLDLRTLEDPAPLLVQLPALQAALA